MGIILLAALTFFWGINWPIMKIVLTEIPPWTFRSICLAFGGVGLLTLVKAQGISLAIPKKEIKPLFLVASTNITGWHLFSAHGLVYMQASRASIIAFTMPIWAALLSSFLLKERLTIGRLSGLGLGIAGLAILIGPDIQALGAAPAGAGFMLGAAVSWGAGTVWLKYFKWTMPVSLLTGWQLILGGVPIVLGALLVEPTTTVLRVSGQCILALVYVILVAIIFSQWAWIKVVSLFPATVAAIGTLVIPIIGVFSSALVLSEPVGLREVAALTLIVLALAIVMIRPE